MFEEQEIYDSPEQSTRRPSGQSLNQNQRQQIKKHLLDAYLILTKNTPSSVEVAQCHKVINEYMSDPDILEIMFELIVQYNETNEILTKLVITQVFAYMKKQIGFGYKEKHDKVIINELFLALFIESNVDFKFKKMLENSYMKFIYQPQNPKLREAVVSRIDKKLTQIFSSTTNSLTALENYNRLASPISLMIPPEEIMNEKNIKICFSLIHVLRALFIGGNLELEALKAILSYCLSIFYLTILTTVKAVFKAVQMKHEQLFAIKVDELAKFMELFVMMYSKMDSGKFPQLRQRLLHTRQVYRLLTVILGISHEFTSFSALKNILAQDLYPQGKQTSFSVLSFEIQQHINFLELEKTFLKSAQEEPLDENSKRVIFSLKSMKKDAIQIFLKSVKVIGKKDSKAFTHYPYISAIVTALWLKIKDCIIVETESYLQAIETQSKQSQISETKRQHHEFLSMSIKFLAACVRLPCMYTMTSPYQNDILFRLCFPWLIARKQHQRFEAEDYVFFREDIVNKQNMSYVENSIGTLIEAYMDNIDGVVTGIMTNCTNLIEYHLTKSEKCLQNMVPELKELWAVTFYTPQRQIESALTMIAIQSYLSLQRNDLALTLQRFIVNHKSFFLSLENDFRISLQFLIMYSYYVDNFYFNIIQGVSCQNFEFREIHQDVLKFCCYLMKANYDYEKNNYKGRNGQILFLAALDCLNNSFNHGELSYVLFCHFPPKHEMSIPHYMMPYENYPFYPIKKNSNVMTLKKLPGNVELKKTDDQSFIDPSHRKDKVKEEAEQEMKEMLMHYRKLGVNKDENFDKAPIVEIIQFLCENFESKANIKIIEVIIEINLCLIKDQLSMQGTVINIPCIFRSDIATLLALKVYSLLHTKPYTLPNRNLFMSKATELLYVAHTISSDAYYIYSLGMDIVWTNPNFWNFDQNQENDNVDKLLKCTDLVVRLALKHYTSEKGVNVAEILQKITVNFTQFSFLYIKKVKKFNFIFGIFLNLILLKTSPQRIFDFLYLLITQKLIQAELNNDIDLDSDQDQQDEARPSKVSEISSSESTDLLNLSFYLFLANMYRNPDCLNSEKNFQLLKVFHDYLIHYTNTHNIVKQLGDVFGKVFACCLCIFEREFTKDTLKQFDRNLVEFFWRNFLYSGKIYKTTLELRVVAIKLINVMGLAIRRNDSEFSLERLQQMYQTACSCIFYSKNRDVLEMENEEEDLNDFQNAGEEQEWQNESITLRNNDTENYIEDDVLLLKKLSRELLESENESKKKWMTGLIEGLPGAVRFFVKNKVINYQQETREFGLRKIMKVKRPEGYGESKIGVTKQDIIKQNTQNECKEDDDQK